MSSERNKERELLILDKINFNTKISRRQRRIYYNDRGSIHQEDVLINVYTPNNGASKYLK